MEANEEDRGWESDPKQPGISVNGTTISLSDLSGQSGLSGPSGLSGLSSQSGISGQSGLSCPSELSGIIGQSVLSGLSRPSGPSELSGLSGASKLSEKSRKRNFGLCGDRELINQRRLSRTSQADSAFASNSVSTTVNSRNSESRGAERNQHRQLKWYLSKLRSLGPRQDNGKQLDSLGALKHFIRTMKAAQTNAANMQATANMNAANHVNSANANAANADSGQHPSSPFSHVPRPLDQDSNLSDISVSSAASNCCFILTADKYSVQKVTHRLANILGHSQGFLVGRTILNVIHPQDVDHVSEQLEAFVEDFTKVPPYKVAGKCCNLLFRLKVRRSGYGIQFSYQPFVAKAYVCKLRPLGELMDSLYDISSHSVSDDSTGEQASSTSSSGPPVSQAHLPGLPMHSSGPKHPVSYGPMHPAGTPRYSGPSSQFTPERKGTWNPRPEAPPPWKHGADPAENQRLIGTGKSGSAFQSVPKTVPGGAALTVASSVSSVVPGSVTSSVTSSNAADSSAAARPSINPDELLTKVTDEVTEEEMKESSKSEGEKKVDTKTEGMTHTGVLNNIIGGALGPKPASPFVVPPRPVDKPAKPIKKKDICIVMRCAPIQSAYVEPFMRPVNGTFSVRHTTQCIYDNVDPQCISLLGYTPVEMIGTSIFCYYRAEDLPMLYGVYQEVVQTPGRMICCQPYALRAKNGDYVVVDTEWSSYTNPWSGKLEFIVCKHTVLQGPQNPNIFMEPIIKDNQENVEFEGKIRNLLLRPYLDKQTEKTETEDSPDSPQEVITKDVQDKDKDTEDQTKTEMKCEEQEEDVEDSSNITQAGCDSILKDHNISQLYHGLSYTQNIKRFLLTCGTDAANDLQSMSESTSELEGMDVSLPLPHLESCASSTKALVSEIEPREEVMSPHHEPEALLHDFDLDTPEPDHLESTKSSDRMDNEEQGTQKKQPFKTMLMTEENLKNHQNNEMKLYIERMIQEKASLILTQYHSRLKRSHYPNSDHRPTKYQIMTSGTDGNHPLPTSAVEHSFKAPPPIIGQQCAMDTSGYNVYLGSPSNMLIGGPEPDRFPWKRSLELLPMDPVSHKHAWAFRHKNKRAPKNKSSTTTSSDSSSMSWLTGTSGSHHKKGKFIEMKVQHEKVMHDPFWREEVNWSKDLELRYSCPLRVVTTKGMRSSLRKLTTPKLIKRQLQEIAQNSPSSDTTPNSPGSDHKSPEPTDVLSDKSGLESGRESSMSPPAVSNNSNASVSGESDSNSNEKSENGSGESNSLISGSYMSGENSSSMKESDDMSHENEIETGSKSDKMFVPVKKSHDLGKAPFWVQSIAQSGLGFQQGSALFEGNATGANRPKFIINHQPDGVLQQLQELMTELHCDDSSETSSTEDEKSPPSYDFVTEEKTLAPSEQASEKMNGGSSMGDSGFKSCSTSCNGNNSIKQNESSCSMVSTGDSGSDKKDPEEDGCGTSTSSDKDSGNEEESKVIASGNTETLMELDSSPGEQNYEELVQGFEVRIKSNGKGKGKSSKKLRKGKNENTSSATKQSDSTVGSKQSTKDCKADKCTIAITIVEKQREAEAEDMSISNSSDDGDETKVEVEEEKGTSDTDSRNANIPSCEDKRTEEGNYGQDQDNMRTDECEQNQKNLNEKEDREKCDTLKDSDPFIYIEQNMDNESFKEELIENKHCEIPIFRTTADPTTESLDTTDRNAFDLSSTSSYGLEPQNTGLPEAGAEGDINDYLGLLFTESYEFIMSIC